MNGNENEFVPPPGPPPFLNVDQLVQLATQGWVILPTSKSSSHAESHPLSSLERSLTSFFPLLQLFFDQPLHAKKGLYPVKKATKFGYYRIEDEKEYITLQCSVHGHSELEKAAAAVWADAAVLLRRVLCDISNGLSLHPDVWISLLDGTDALPQDENTMNSGTQLRLFRYEAGKGFAEDHTDLGLLTLCYGDQTGLQVLDRETVEQGGPEHWTDVGPGEMVILAGQTVKALTDGRVRAGVHRVVPSEWERHSVVFALRHSRRHDVDMNLFGGEGKIESKKLWEALKIGIVNINAPKKWRDKQKIQLDRMRGKREQG